jgi:predicted transcriptional regulator
MGEEALELENRRRIYRLVEKFPGIHLRDIQKRLDLSMGVLEYHLNYMEKEQLLSAESDGYRRSYFVRSGVQHGDKATLTLLRQEAPRRIIILILLKGRMTFREILDETKTSKSTLSFHMKKLTESGLVASEKVGRELAYAVKDPDATAKLIVTYKESFLDSVVDRFVEAWLEI